MTAAVTRAGDYGPEWISLHTEEKSASTPCKRCRRAWPVDVALMASELKLRAERRLGELLAETVDHSGGGVARFDTTKQLPDGVSRSQSSRWQAVAS